MSMGKSCWMKWVLVACCLLMSACGRHKTYVVAIEVAPEGAGYGIGEGEYEDGATLQIAAEANPGYSFFIWNDGVTANPRTITVRRHITYKAHFVSDGNEPEPRPGDYDARCSVTFGDRQWQARAVLYRDYAGQAPAGYPTLLLQPIADDNAQSPLAGVQMYATVGNQTPASHPHILMWYADDSDDFYTIDGVSYPHWLTTDNQVSINVEALDLTAATVTLDATSSVLDMRQESLTPGENREVRNLRVRMEGSMLLAGQSSGAALLP